MVFTFMFGLFLFALHAFLVVLEVTGGRFLPTLLTLAVIEETLDGRDQEHDAEYQPSGDQRSNQDCLCVVTVIIAPPSIQEVFIVIAGEVRLCTCLAAERLTVTDLQAGC